MSRVSLSRANDHSGGTTTEAGFSLGYSTERLLKRIAFAKRATSGARLCSINFSWFSTIDFNNKFESDQRDFRSDRRSKRVNVYININLLHSFYPYCKYERRITASIEKVPTNQSAQGHAGTAEPGL